MEEFKCNLSFTGLMIPLIIPNISLQKSYFRRYVTPKMTIEENIFLSVFLISFCHDVIVTIMIEMPPCYKIAFPAVKKKIMPITTLKQNYRGQDQR